MRPAASSLMRGLSALWVAFLLSGCVSLNYPRAQTTAIAPPDAAADADLVPASAPLPSTEEQAKAVSDSTAPASSVRQDEIDGAVPEEPLSWSALMRRARDAMTRRDWDQATARLEQAELQVAARAPGHIRRRTVFGMQSRLALAIANEDPREAPPARAVDLANRLASLAGEHPEIAGAAFISLAEVSSRWPNAMDPSEESVAAGLPRLDTALRVAEAQRVSASRLSLAKTTVAAAYLGGDLNLALRAADRAVADAKILAPSRRRDLGLRYFERARILLARGDAERAATDSLRALELFEEVGASPSYRAAVLAQRAQALMQSESANEALAALEEAEELRRSSPAMSPAAQRDVLTARARISSQLGETGRARNAYAEAVALPEQGRIDAYRLKALRQELADLGS